ncbi:hypothetical protein EDC94DRAFT_615499 [Helicostylum pulchrum]|nr:hypothetical protein EDC94DRAFT_615499 [Helicostylum pulchrum]
MGQGESKFKGSFAFGYLDESPAVAAAAASVIRKMSSEERDDYLLQNPQGYGFNKYRHHRDSGYYDQSLQVDLNYIDNTYYSTSTTITTTTTTTGDNQQQVEEIEEENNQAQISFADVFEASADKSLRQVYLSNRSIHRLSPNIGMLTMIRKLDLSSNHLTELPESIGYMQNLETLCIAKNKLKSLPDTIGYLSNLLEFDISFNQLQVLTPCISYLEKLKILSLAYNQLQYLPNHISGLSSLISLDLTRNPLKVLPAEISKLPYLRRIRLEDCPFKTDLVYSLKHDPPTLLEICARNIRKSENNGNINYQQQLPLHLSNYIQSAKSCTSCHGPYYDSFVLRGRLMEKTDMHIPLEYTLCSAHWSDADDRILSMFSTQPSTTTQVVHQPYRPKLPCPPKSFDPLSTTTITTRKRHQLTTVDNQLVPAKTNQNHQSRFNTLTSKFKSPW